MNDRLLKGICHVRLFAMPQTWSQTLQFYSEILGLGCQACDDEAGYAIIGFNGGTTLGIERINPDDDHEVVLVGRFSGVSFEVDDILLAYNDLQEKGVKFESPPEKQAWGGILVDFRDPAGNELTLVQSSRTK